MPTSEEIAQQLALLKIEFASSLTSRISQLIKDLKELHQQQDPAASLQESFRQIHSLSGSAGTFGYHHLSDQARQCFFTCSPSQASRPTSMAPKCQQWSRWFTSTRSSQIT